MDRVRPVYTRQPSGSNTPTAGPPSSPMNSPFNRHIRTGSTGNMRKPQNTKAAAQRLAQVMAHQMPDNEDDEDDLLYDYTPANLLAGVGTRPVRNRSPMAIRNPIEQPSHSRATSSLRSSPAVNSMEQHHSSARPSSVAQLSSSNSSEKNSSSQSVVAGHSSQLTSSVEDMQPPSATSNSASSRSSQFNAMEQPSSARSSCRPNLPAKTIPMVPPVVPLSLKPTAPAIQPDDQPDTRKDKRLSLDFGTFKYKEPSQQPSSSSALQDELDMLQEENESLLGKVRLAEEKCEEAEARARQLEQQVANLGDGISLEARLLNRKEAALQQREAALKVVSQNYGGKGEIEALRTEAETAREEANSALEQLHEIGRELKSLRTMTQRVMLTQEEMEEVVLKRCWLARYWSLCVEYGIHPEIARARNDYWSSFAPHPTEVVLSTGQRAKDEDFVEDNDLEEREKGLRNMNELVSEGSVESMLFVEKGLREMSSLKVEEAVAFAMAQKRRPGLLRASVTDDLKLPIDGQPFTETIELSKEESDDVRFKRAWLTYFWRRAKNHGLNPDIAEERLEYWISQEDVPPTFNTAVDAERGLIELRKLGIETQLWEESRKKIDPDSNYKTQMDFEQEY